MSYLRTRFSVLALSSFLVVGCAADTNSDGTDDSQPSDDTDQSPATGQKSDAGVKDAGKVAAKDASTPRTVADAGGHTPTSPSHDAATPTEPELDAGPSQAGADAAADAGKSDAGHAAAADGGGAAGSCDGLTYDSFGKMFFSNYCVSCHGGGVAQAGIKLDALAGVQTNKAKVKSEVSKSSMPPRGSKAPTMAERTQLGQWIDCGAK